MTDERRTAEAIDRAITIARKLAQGDDLHIRERIGAFGGEADYSNRESLAIRSEAWDRVRQADIEPRLVFAHPAVLEAMPEASIHYRGIALLPLKRVTEIVGSVERWERQPARARVTRAKAVRVARLYNTVISSIILDNPVWTAGDGHRNVLATIGITADGGIRNLIGQQGERAIRRRMIAWIRGHGLLAGEDPGDDAAEWRLSRGVLMRFGTEPDVGFEQNEQLVALIEIKAGKDPAGALERLGAVKKTFDAAPTGCRNFLVAGIVTSTMRERLAGMRMERSYDMDRLLLDEDSWAECMNDIFHHALRIAPDVRPPGSGG